MSVDEAVVPFNDLSRFTPALREGILEATSRVFDRGWFAMGPENQALEKELEAFLDVAHAALTANGTDSLVLALSALGVGRGDLVLTCANAGGYTATATRLLGATPVYCDVDPATLLATVDTVAAGFDQAVAVHGREPSCIVVTHLYGASADIFAITAWAHRRGIPVLEDCAQALGGTIGGTRLGSVGDISITSFYPTKNLGALGDAGAVFTNTPELDARVRRLRQYGWETKYRSATPGGMNSRCDELQAAILRVKLPLLDGWNARRRDIHAQYEGALDSTDVRLLHSSESEHVGHLAVLIAADRDATARVFSRHGVTTDIHYPVCDHRQQIAENDGASLPVSEYAVDHVLSIPLFPELTDVEIERVVAALRDL